MKFDISSTIIQPSTDLEKKIVAMRWSPDGERVAVVTADHLITLYSVSTSSSSKIPVKAKEENSPVNFTLTSIDWMPDSTGFIVAQSDKAVSVYDVGVHSAVDYKKKISQRVTTKAVPLVLGWPVTSLNDFVIGLADGKVLSFSIKAKKQTELYSYKVPPLSIACSNRQSAVVVGHMDGQVIMYNLDSRTRQLTLKLSSPPMALAWGSQVVAAGADLQVNFADANGSGSSVVEYSNQPDLQCFTGATFDPSGSTAMVAGKDALFTYNYSSRLQNWSQATKLEFKGLYTPTHLSWSPDGAKIAVASATSAVHLITASIGSFRYKNFFECIYVNSSQIKVLDLKTKSSLNLKSDFRILKTNFHQNRYVVSRTAQSFIIGDTKSGKITEFPAAPMEGDPKITERFVFMDDFAVLVWNTGELTVVEMGKSTSLATIATQYASSYLLSLRFGAKIGNGNSKILSYLVDSKTIRIVDIESMMTVGTVQVENKVDWMEINLSGTMLLFRDSKRFLYLYNLVTRTRTGLISYCSYAQWVPGANVIVAQSKNNLFVWYSPTSPDEVRVTEIEGEVVDITRSGIKTVVSIQQGANVHPFPLDGAFISFSAAMETKQLNNAAKILLQVKSTEVRSLWAELAQVALEKNDYVVAETAFASIGDLSKARFLHKINKLVAKHGISHALVQSKIAQLQSNFKQAEYILVEHDQIDEALEMYRSMHMFDEMLNLAELRIPQKAKQLRDEYLTFLITTNQYQKAAEVKATRGDVNDAVDLCIQGNVPQKAAELLLRPEISSSTQLITHVAEKCVEAKYYEFAGKLYEKLGKASEAFDCYRKGNVFFQALELAKISNPGEVHKIEKEWGDYLFSQGQYEAASYHFVEAGDYTLALNCALRTQQWDQAFEILRSVSHSLETRDSLKTQYLRVARYFASVGEIEKAEDLFLSVDANKELIQMYLEVGKIDEANRLAKRQLPSKDVKPLFESTAAKLGKKPETMESAEKIYILLKDPESAIQMYKTAGNTEKVLELSQKFPSDPKQLQTLGVQHEEHGDYQAAERCYVGSGNPDQALVMYKTHKDWENAWRVAHAHCPKDEVQVAFLWAREIGGQAGVSKLSSLKMTDKVLMYACENQYPDFAVTIIKFAKDVSKDATKKAHFQLGRIFEVQGSDADAEAHYLQADDPQAAYDMYVSKNDAQSAQRIATRFNIESQSVRKPVQQPQQEGALNIAKEFERQKRYAEAINAYLRVSISECGNQATYLSLLGRTVNLCARYNQNQLGECVQEVAKIMMDLGEHQKLGEILEKIDAYSDAVQVYRVAGLWEEAKRISHYLDPAELQSFNAEYEAQFMNNQDSRVVFQKNQKQALDMLVQQGKWDECLQLAQTADGDLPQEYTMKCAQNFIDQAQYEKAISVLSKYSPSPSPKNIPAYTALVQKTLYGTTDFETIPTSFFDLRKMLFKILKGLPPSAVGFLKLQEFTRAVHLLCQIYTLRKFQQSELLIRTTLSILRYCDLVPADYLFYQAGYILEQNNQQESAYVFYGRFIEIYEVIQNPSSTVDNDPFVETDIPQANCIAPRPTVSKTIFEKTNQWAISKAIQDDFNAQLPTVSCRKCGKQIFKGNLNCPFCKEKYEFCHITGSPVLNPTQCTACGCLSNRADWGIYISKSGKCPCCDAPQTAGA